jgi:hypothetical protein
MDLRRIPREGMGRVDVILPAIYFFGRQAHVGRITCGEVIDWATPLFFKKGMVYIALINIEHSLGGVRVSLLDSGRISVGRDRQRPSPRTNQDCMSNGRGCLLLSRVFLAHRISI